MFRRAASTEEPRFLKDLLEALRDSEEDLAEAEAASEAPLSALPSALAEPDEEVVVDIPPSHDADPGMPVDATDTYTIWAEIAILRELSAEWKEAVRLDREQSHHLSGMALAA